MKIADKNVRILKRLINQILDFRKYENGKLDLRLTEIDFDRATRDWMESFYTIAAKRDIHLTLAVPADGTNDNSTGNTTGRKPPRVAIDTEKIGRVFFTWRPAPPRQPLRPLLSGRPRASPRLWNRAFACQGVRRATWRHDIRGQHARQRFGVYRDAARHPCDRQYRHRAKEH